MARLVCLSGTGATGKTSVINEVLRIAPGRFTFMPSIVRGFYAANGIKNEVAFANETDPAKKFDFQGRLFQFYVSEVTRQLSECMTPWLIVDRAAFDHAAYSLHGAGSALTKEMFFQIQHGLEPFLALDPLVLLMPFPVMWNEAASDDGFRHRDFQKDLAVDAYIRKLATCEHELGTVIDAFGTNDSVSTRAATVLRYVDIAETRRITTHDVMVNGAEAHA